eukprot:scaffold22737_cov120-Cylindrotheca_fusiformis.AAC.2
MFCSPEIGSGGLRTKDRSEVAQKVQDSWRRTVVRPASFRDSETILKNAEFVHPYKRVYPPSAVRDEPFIHAVSMPKANSTDGPSDAALSARQCSITLERGTTQCSLHSRKDQEEEVPEGLPSTALFFVPFVVSTDGLLGPEAQMFKKKLAADLSVRWDQPKSVVTNFIHARLGIAILRATHRCIRGPQFPASKMSQHIEWTGPSGLALF